MSYIHRILLAASGLLILVAAFQPKDAHAQWAKGDAQWYPGTTDNNYYTASTGASGTKDKSKTPGLKSKVTGTAGPGAPSSQYASSVQIGQQGGWEQQFLWSGSGTIPTLSFSGSASVTLTVSGASYFSGQSYLNCGNPYFGGGVILNLTSPSSSPLTGTWSTSASPTGAEYYYMVNFNQNLNLRYQSPTGAGASANSEGTATITVN